MSELQVRGYRCEDQGAVMDVWNAALPYDTIDASTFQRKVLLDPNFDAEWLLVADSGTQVVGFCLCLIRRLPTSDLDMEPGRGWITSMGVLPCQQGCGVGSALLERAVELFAGQKRAQIDVAPYTPNYFVPGVDTERYARGLEFLQTRGFERLADAVSMDANIVLLRDGDWLSKQAALVQRGFLVRSMRSEEMPALGAFLKAHMPADWVRHGRELMVDVTRGLAGLDQFTLAFRGDDIVGFCLFEGEHFGPFGVREDMQGQGIGTVMLANCLMAMRARGHHNAWVLWTGDRAAEHVYSRFGFTTTRRFAVLRRRL